MKEINFKKNHLSQQHSEKLSMFEAKKKCKKETSDDDDIEGKIGCGSNNNPIYDEFLIVFVLTHESKSNSRYFSGVSVDLKYSVLSDET